MDKGSALKCISCDTEEFRIKETSEYLYLYCHKCDKCVPIAINLKNGE